MCRFNKVDSTLIVPNHRPTHPPKHFDVELRARRPTFLKSLKSSSRRESSSRRGGVLGDVLIFAVLENVGRCVVLPFFTPLVLGATAAMAGNAFLKAALLLLW